MGPMKSLIGLIRQILVTMVPLRLVVVETIWEKLSLRDGEGENYRSVTYVPVCACLCACSEGVRKTWVRGTTCCRAYSIFIGIFLRQKKKENRKKNETLLVITRQSEWI